EPGDEVLCPDPGFPIYESVVRLAGGRPVLYPLDGERGFAPDVHAIAERITPRTGMLVLNLPHNPTGGVAAPGDEERLAELALRRAQDPVHRMVAALKTKRDLIVNGLGKIDGIRCACPAGAFYAFPNVASILERAGLKAQGLADRLLADYGAAVLAGTAFGPGGEGHLRLSFATSPEHMALGLERLARCVTDLRTSAPSRARSP